MNKQDLHVLRKIQTEHEQKGNFKVNTKFSNEEILEAKGIMKYTSNIDPEIFNARCCMGWLTMKSQGAGLKTIKLGVMFKKKWFFLISQRPIIEDY